MAYHRPFIPILPRPSPSQAERQRAPAAPNYTAQEQRVIVAAACESCRQRKVKCDGSRPKCLQCFRRGRNCRYVANTGETRNQAVKRKYKESQNRLAAFEELFSFLATKSEIEAAEVWARIRDGNSPEDILRYIRDADILLQLHLVPDVHYQYTFPYMSALPSFITNEDNPYLQSWLYRCSSLGETEPNNEKLKSNPRFDPYHIPFHAAELVDIHLSTISAKKWTTITSNDMLVRKLLETFFFTEFSWYPTFQKDLFLRDMAQGQENYCSSLLVNAILASACHGYSKFLDRANSWNPRTLGYKFLAEARRLWDIEIANPRITTIQAAIALSLTHDADGNDKLGNVYLQRAVEIAHQLQLFSSLRLQHEDANEYNARAITAWGLFGIQAVHCFHVFSPPLLTAPPDIALPDPKESPSFYGEFHLKYPLRQTLLPVACGTIFKALSEFRTIINDLAVAFFIKKKKHEEYNLNLVQSVWLRLGQWYMHLPEDLVTRNIAFPWQLKLHMHYYNIIIYLLETMGGASEELLQVDDHEQALQDARTRFETIIRLYYLRHGYESYDIFMVHYCSFLGSIHIQSLGKTEATERKEKLSTIALMLKGLRDQGRNYYLAQVVFRLVKSTLGAEAQQLMREITDVSQEDEQRKSFISRQVNSAWPVGVAAFVDNPDALRLGNIQIADE